MDDDLFTVRVETEEYDRSWKFHDVWTGSKQDLKKRADDCLWNVRLLSENKIVYRTRST